jgi:hypothetical protein
LDNGSSASSDVKSFQPDSESFGFFEVDLDGGVSGNNSNSRVGTVGSNPVTGYDDTINREQQQQQQQQQLSSQ